MVDISYYHERKYRDTSIIYRVSEVMETIFGGEISIRGNFGKNPKKSTISRDFGDKSPIFAHISYGQRGQVCYSEVKMRYSAATISTTVC